MTTYVKHSTSLTSLRVIVSVETFCYLIVLIAAVLIRATDIGKTPLSEEEAQQATAARNILSLSASGDGTILSPLVLGGTSAAFALMSMTNEAARLTPLLAGIILAFCPLLYRSQLGRATTWLAVAILSVSPSMVAASRMISGVGLAMLALAVTIFSVGMFQLYRQQIYTQLAGAGLALGVLSNFGFIPAVISIILGVAFATLTDEEKHFTIADIRAFLSLIRLPVLLTSFGATLILTGTLFFVAPFALGAGLESTISTFLRGILNRGPEVPYLGLVLFAYEPFLLVFGLVGAWLASQSSDPRHRILAGWGVSALLICLIYPGALPLHGLWSVIPMAMLAAYAITAALKHGREVPNWIARVGITIVVTLFAMSLSFLIHQLRHPMTYPLLNDQSGQMIVGIQSYLVLSVVCAGLIVLLWFGLAALWGAKTAWSTIAVGFAAMGIVLAFGQSVALVTVRNNSEYELFNYASSRDGLNRLVETAEQVSELTTGNRFAAEITAETSPDSALGWALRHFSNVRLVDRTTANVQSAMVITPVENAAQELGSNYTGQSFVIHKSWTPDDQAAGEFLVWLLYRDGSQKPGEEVRVILWVRLDVYRLVPNPLGK